MASFWFVTAPLPGHLDWGGMLKTAKLLRAGGHEVLWVSQPPIAPMVEAAGIEFAPIAETGWLWPPPPMPDPRTLKPAEGIFLRYRRALDTWLSEALIPPAVQAIVALANERGKPSTIVADPFLTAAAFAAEALDVPLIVSSGTGSIFPSATRTINSAALIGPPNCAKSAAHFRALSITF